MSQSSPRPVWLDHGRIPALDGLRGIAILFVLLAHGSQTHGFPLPFLSHFATIFGSLGVQTFFALSGFLITLLMQRELQRTGDLNLKGFYWRRVLRIFPAYISYLLAVAAFQYLGVADLTRADWIGAITYTVNFFSNPSWEIGHSWSLSIEEHFYLLWPAAVILLPPHGKVRALVGTLLTCFTLRWVVLLLLPGWTKLAETWTFTRLDSIAVGCLLALLVQHPLWRTRLDQVARYWPLVLGILGLSLAAGHFSTKIDLGFVYSISSISLGLLVWSAVQWNPAWLNNRLLSAIGIGSYSLYLWQQLFLNPQLEAWWTMFPTNIVLACLTAWISYRYIESPFLRLKERQQSRKLHPANPGTDPHEDAAVNRELELAR